mgnify:FL=1
MSLLKGSNSSCNSTEEYPKGKDFQRLGLQDHQQCRRRYPDHCGRNLHRPVQDLFSSHLGKLWETYDCGYFAFTL